MLRLASFGPCRRWALACALLLLPLCACRSRPDIPPTAEVTGVVTLDGKSVPGAEVQFIPDTSRGTTGPPALGYCDDEGRYELTTSGIKGAIVGQHRVRIEARAKPKNEMDTLPARLTPERYASEATSNLTAEVKAGEANVIDFKLTTQP